MLRYFVNGLFSTVFGLWAAVTELVSGAGRGSGDLLPDGAIQSNTDLGVPGYGGAAPNPGPAHRYVITVYALDKLLELDEHTTPAYVGYSMHFSTLAKASLLVYGESAA